MPNEEEGQKAIDQLNGTSCEGQTITVNVGSSPRGALFGRLRRQSRRRLRRQPWRRLRRQRRRLRSQPVLIPDFISERISGRAFLPIPYGAGQFLPPRFLFFPIFHTPSDIGKKSEKLPAGPLFFPKKAITCRHEGDGARKTQGAGRVGQIRRFVRFERRDAQASCGRGGQRRGVGHLPLLHGRRTLRLAAEDHAHQHLHARLRLLHQPPQQRHSARRLHAGRTGRTDHRVLSPQLHRGAFPLVGRRPRSGLRWSAWSAWPATCARCTVSTGTSI